jgi:rhodanese-related sulfurtransferase
MATDELIPLEITPARVKQMLDSTECLLLLDCREPDEYAAVHIDRALLLPMSQIAERLGELNPYRDQSIVVHCHHGGRSLRIARWLREQGFSRAQSMAGGIDQWAVDIDPSLPRY